MNPRPRIRWLVNASLDVINSKGTFKRNFNAGSYMLVNKVVIYPDGYGDIYIGGDYVGETPTRIEGVQLRDGDGTLLIECHGTAVIEESETKIESPAKIEEPAKKEPSKRKWPKKW